MATRATPTSTSLATTHPTSHTIVSIRAPTPWGDWQSVGVRRHGEYNVPFFFQAEDGIRYLTVTGVQTCALPICAVSSRGMSTSDFMYVSVAAITMNSPATFM